MNSAVTIHNVEIALQVGAYSYLQKICEGKIVIISATLSSEIRAFTYTLENFVSYFIADFIVSFVFF